MTNILSLLDNTNAQDVNLPVTIKIIFIFTSPNYYWPNGHKLALSKSIPAISGSLQRSFLCTYKKKKKPATKTLGQ